MEQGLTNKAGLDAGGFGKDCVVGVTTHMQLLIQIQPLELALVDRRCTFAEHINRRKLLKMHTDDLLWQQYLWAAINWLPSVHDDVTQGEVAMQLHCVKLSQLDGVGAAYGGHARAHVKPETTKQMVF